MKDYKMDQFIDTEIIDSRWKSLYRVGGRGAIIVATLLFIEIIVFSIWPQQTTAIAFFTLFQSNKLIGLIDFYLLEMFAYIFFAPIFLAIYASMRKINESYMLIAIILAFIGISVFLSTNNSFSLLNLSNQYWAATTEAQQSILLAAGQTIIDNTGQRAIGGFNTGFFLVSIAGFMVSAVMLKSTTFSKKTAYVGIFAFGISLIDYLRIIFIPSAAVILLIIAVTSGIFLILWFVLVGRRLIHLGKN